MHTGLTFSKCHALFKVPVTLKIHSSGFYNNDIKLTAVEKLKQ
jgi:hypothetical protein